MFKAIYIVVMLGVIVVVTAISVPSLIHKKCPKCRARNSLDATHCTACGEAFPESDG